MLIGNGAREYRDACEGYLPSIMYNLRSPPKWLEIRKASNYGNFDAIAVEATCRKRLDLHRPEPLTHHRRMQRLAVRLASRHEWTRQWVRVSLLT